MPRPSKFTVLKLARPGGRALFRIVIPARFTAEGKRKAVYYQTAAAAEADARTLRAMHTQGTIGLLSLLTPEQVKDARAFLAACRDLRPEYKGRFALDCTDCRPAVAVLLFAGARPAELARLTWKDLHPQADGSLLLFVHGKNAKTKTSRFIRVRPNLRAFLESVPPTACTGKIIPPDWPRKIQAVRAAAGLAGRADTARHSFASYALAAGEPLHDVMADMGHVQASTVIFTHYRAAASPAAAREYWAIRP